MATDLKFASQSVPVSDVLLSGGLNSSAGPLKLNNNESSDLQNVDFDKFGSILKRNGYDTLNSTAISGSPNSDGLFWFEFNSGGSAKTSAINIADGKMWKMDDLDGTWDDITGGLTITADNFCSFDNWLNTVYVTNNEDPPFKWTGTGDASALTVPTGLTDAKFVKQFNNYLFLGNVAVSGTRHASRIYWSDLNVDSSWTVTNFIDISKNDGQEITGLKVLADRLVVYKSRSIYNVFFTGDADIPFILPGGGKSASAVGCIAPYSIQDALNGHVFLSYDGLYYYDGNNAQKISDKINDTFNGYNVQKFNQAVSLVQKTKTRYMVAVPASGATNNNRIVIWDYFNNSFSIYNGKDDEWEIASMSTFFISDREERLYFGDYDGFVYRMDTGYNDNPLGVETAVESYYYTNWKHYGDICDQKGIASVYIYYQISSSTVSFAYSYDFEESDEYSLSMDISTSGDVYGVGLYGTATYAKSGGNVRRKDLIGRGRVVRFKFENNTLDETFQIDGFGSYAHLETQV